jgi:hypothetical protein
MKQFVRRKYFLTSNEQFYGHLMTDRLWTKVDKNILQNDNQIFNWGENKTQQKIALLLTSKCKNFQT